MTQHSLTTRLGEYISLVLPDAHGHQHKAITDFVLAVVMVQSCCQARLARFFDNFESASKRLSRLIHNPRLATDELALAHARFLVQARARDKQGRWGIWHLLSNRNLSALGMTHEYARRFTCEEGFRDAKRLLGFAEARISCLAAWVRVFTLVAIALAVLTNVGSALATHARCDGWLRRVRSRRRTRSELSMVCAVATLLTHDEGLWQLLGHSDRLNLEANL